jgi:rhodanese-related sulfurtransferase
VQALYGHGGYIILDIRTPSQLDRFGKVPKVKRAVEGGYAVDVPYKLSKRRFEDGKSTETESDNPDFLAEVNQKFKNKDTKLLVLDFDGSHAIEALEALFENGFENIVGIQGGYKKWFKTWDNTLKRRNLGEYQEHSWGQGETSCGIHASGAGFENQDAASRDFWSGF